MSWIRSWFRRERIGLTLVVLAIIVLLLAWMAPQDRTLRADSRVVYLHGALVWAAILSFLAAGLVGLGALIWDRGALHAWTQALGRTALLFWAGYLPLSMIASHQTWGGIFWQEPRYRTAFQVLALSLAVQAAGTLWGRRRISSLLNTLMAIALVWLLTHTEAVLHPVNPIARSTPMIQLFFGLLVGGTGLAALQVARWHRARIPGE